MYQNKLVHSFAKVLLVLFLINGILVTNVFSQPIVSGTLGINIAGDLEFRRGGYGLSVGYLTKKIGFELEIMRHQHFFKDSDMLSYIKDPNIDMNTDAILYTLNILYPVQLKHHSRLHPLISGGAGIYHSWFDAINYLSLPSNQTPINHEYDTLDTRQNNLGFHLGVGVMPELKNKNLRLRSELRYSYGLANKDQSTGGYFTNFGFLRFSLGISYLFTKNK